MEQLRQRTGAVKLGHKGLVIVGPDRHGTTIDEIAAFAVNSGLPLICDTPARCGSMAECLVTSADLLLALPHDKPERPDFLIRFGSAPVSNDLQRYIGRFEGPSIHISDGKFSQDYLSPRALAVPNPDIVIMDSLRSVIDRDTHDWLDSWIIADRRASGFFSQAVARAGWSELQAVDCLLRTAGIDFISMSNSLSIRLVNLLSVRGVPSRPTYVNRGLSGIDGNLSTFFGTLSVRGDFGAAVIGDLAFLHDMTSLEFLRHTSPDCIILVLNNEGAGLFDLLPLQTVPEYNRLIRNSVNYDISLISKAFGIRHAACCNIMQVNSVISDYDGGTLLIEAKFGREMARRGLKRFTQSMMASLKR
jgi:2-succinyl-5-enolpyruvyl-6-hydroxy-3-cyclohexene-1-carboxylate synthase